MYELMKAKADLREATEKLQRREGQKTLLEQQKAAALTRKAKAEQDLGNYDKVQILLQLTSEYARAQAKERIEDIVTQALSVVFGNDYKFSIVLDVKGNQPVAEYYLTSEDVTTQLKPPDYDRGGGVADVVSLALRLAVGEITGIEGPLFLDEIGKHVDEERAPHVAYFLKQYGDRFKRQMILVTHNSALADVGDNAVRIRKVGSAAKVAKG